MPENEDTVPSKRQRSRSPALAAPTAMPADAKLLRACTQCHSRKVKCDGAVPYCTPCFKSQRTSTCDTLDCVVWTHRNVLAREERHARLAARLDWLEAELSHCTGLSAADIETGTSIAARLARPEATSASDPLALELGLLALEAGSGLRTARYVGTASGLTVARRLSSLLHYRANDEGEGEPELRVHRASSICAGLPPLPLARKHLTAYIDKVHRWSPILDLRRLFPVFDALYNPDSPSSPSSLDPFSRFSVFMVLALGRLDSQGATAQAQQQATDGFSAEEYLNAAVVSLDRIMLHSDLDAVAAALLLVLYGLSDPTHPSINVWQWSGFALRLAVELGCSRPARPWQFDDAEKELRRRIWWTAYRLERTVAVRLGRVLSMRNQGIDADWPIQLEELTPPCRLLEAPIRYSLRPALHLMRLARLLGDILESVYIARPLGRPSPSAEETLERVWAIQKELIEWANQNTSIAEPGSYTLNTLSLAFHRACVLLHRPSPSFPQQPTSVHTVCLTSTRAAIVLAKTMLAKGELPRTWASVHDIFVDGLVLIYSSWVSPASENALFLSTLSTNPDMTSCFDTLTTLSHSIPHADRFVRILRRVVSAVERIAAPALNNPFQDGVIGQEADAGPSEAGWPLPAQVAHEAAWEGWEDFGLDSWAIDAVQSMLETGEPGMMG